MLRLAAAALCSTLASAAGASPFRMPDMRAATSYEVKSSSRSDDKRF
jgi:hypothetical protein